MEEEKLPYVYQGESLHASHYCRAAGLYIYTFVWKIHKLLCGILFVSTHNLAVILKEIFFTLVTVV